MPNPLIGITLHQRLWFIYFVVTAVLLTIGIVIGFGVELNIIRVDRQQSGRVIYVGFLSAGGISLIIGLAFIFVPVDRKTSHYSFTGSITNQHSNRSSLLKNEEDKPDQQQHPNGNEVRIDVKEKDNNNDDDCGFQTVELHAVN